MSSKSANSKKTEISSIGKLYLLAYNTVQTLGWGYLLLQTLVYFLNRGGLANYWTEIKWTVVIFQNAAILEVVKFFIPLLQRLYAL